MIALLILFSTQLIGGFFTIICISYLKNHAKKPQLIISTLTALITLIVIYINSNSVTSNSDDSNSVTSNSDDSNSVTSNSDDSNSAVAVRDRLPLANEVNSVRFASSVKKPPQIKQVSPPPRNPLFAPRNPLFELDNQGAPTMVLKSFPKKGNINKAATKKENILGLASVGTTVVIYEIKETTNPSIKLAKISIRDGDLKGQTGWVSYNTIKGPKSHQSLVTSNSDDSNGVVAVRDRLSLANEVNSVRFARFELDNQGAPTMVLKSFPKKGNINKAATKKENILGLASVGTTVVIYEIKETTNPSIKLAKISIRDGDLKGQTGWVSYNTIKGPKSHQSLIEAWQQDDEPNRAVAVPASRQ